MLLGVWSNFVKKKENRLQCFLQNQRKFGISIKIPAQIRKTLLVWMKKVPWEDSEWYITVVIK